MDNFDLSPKEAFFFLALLESNRETALQLLAADHVYEPSLLPRLRKYVRHMKQLHHRDNEQNAFIRIPDMALSFEAETAFNNAIEAAYAMQEAAIQFGNRSEEVEFVSKIYQYWMQEYYSLKDKNDWWADRCLMEPNHPGCKMFDV